MQDLAGGHIELLAQGNEIIVYLFGAEDRPITAEEAKATATVLAGGRQEVVSLQAPQGKVLPAWRLHRCARHEGRAGPDLARATSATRWYAPMD